MLHFGWVFFQPFHPPCPSHFTFEPFSPLYSSFYFRHFVLSYLYFILLSTYSIYFQWLVSSLLAFTCTPSQTHKTKIQSWNPQMRQRYRWRWRWKYTHTHTEKKRGYVWHFFQAWAASHNIIFPQVPSIYLQMSWFICLHMWEILHCIYVANFHYLFVSWWISTLILLTSHCE